MNGRVPVGYMVPWNNEVQVPDGWLPCLGGEASRESDAALFAVLGITYGPGNGVNTFNLPNAGKPFLTEEFDHYGIWIIKR